jgi:hypothetical protein
MLRGGGGPGRQRLARRQRTAIKRSRTPNRWSGRRQLQAWLPGSAQTWAGIKCRSLRGRVGDPLAGGAGRTTLRSWRTSDCNARAHQALGRPLAGGAPASPLRLRGGRLARRCDATGRGGATHWAAEGPAPARQRGGGSDGSTEPACPGSARSCHAARCRRSPPAPGLCRWWGGRQVWGLVEVVGAGAAPAWTLAAGALGGWFSTRAQPAGGRRRAHFERHLCSGRNVGGRDSFSAPLSVTTTSGWRQGRVLHRARMMVPSSCASWRDDRNDRGQDVGRGPASAAEAAD